MAVLGYILSRDHSLMRRINRWSAPQWVRLWMTCATRGGDGWLWYATGLAVLIFGGELRYRAVGAASLAAALSIVVFLWLKRLTGRKRPCHIEPHCWAKLLPPDQFSFPSGHTLAAFAMAVSLMRFYPGMAVGLSFCALSIAASRIVLGMHFLSDVVVGAALGTGLAFAVTSLFL